MLYSVVDDRSGVAYQEYHCVYTVALFIDEAHDLHSRTRLSLKRFMELVHASGETLSVVLAGHPKLTNDLSRPALASPYPASIPRRISLIRRNRHFFATFERLTVPVSGIFVTNCLCQTRKGKLACVAMFLVRSGRSFRAAGPICLQAHVRLFAGRYTYLVKSSPARRAVLTSSPTRVVLWFNERLEAQFSQLSVWNQAGDHVDTHDIQVGPDDPEKLSVGLPALSAGPYTVKFRVLSVDGHVVEAEFPSTVRSRQ
jgi:copper resistance protein C